MCLRERWATRASAILPLEHIRRNHRNIARLYTFAGCCSIGFYRKHLIVPGYVPPMDELQRGTVSRAGSLSMHMHLM